jgi:hypothetical protein
MSRNNECAKLVLRTIDIQTFNNANFNVTLANVNNAFGLIQSRGQYFLWRGVNMKQLLGSLWDRYTMFNLCLRTISKQPGANANNNYAHTIWMTGLNWVNNSYSIVSKDLVNEACVGGCFLISDAYNNGVGNGNVFHQPANSTMFKRGNPITDLSVQLKNSFGTAQANNEGRLEISQNIGGHMELHFEIYGVKGYETDISDTEIFTHNVVSKDTSYDRFYLG